MPVFLKQILIAVGLLAICLFLSSYVDSKIIIYACLAFLIAKHI